MNSISMISMFHADTNTTEIVHLSAGSGFMVTCNDEGQYSLYELNDGTDERFCSVHTTLNEAIKKGLSWT